MAKTFEQARQIYKAFTDDFFQRSLPRYWGWNYAVIAANRAERKVAMQLYGHYAGRRFKRIADFYGEHSAHAPLAGREELLDNWDEVVASVEAYLRRKGLPVFDIEAVRELAAQQGG